MDSETGVDAAQMPSHPMADHLGFLLRRVQLAVFADFQRRTANFDVTPTEYSILQVIHAQPAMQQTRLAEIIGVKPANCVLLITGLENRGLLNRRASGRRLARGRALALALTADGKKLLKKMNERVREHQLFLVNMLGQEAHENFRLQLLSMLEKADQGALG